MNRTSYLLDLRPDSKLVDPHFEGYKLSLDQIPTYRKTLAAGVHIVHPSDKQYSFYHAKCFSLHNHLYVNSEKADCVYHVDDLCRVHKITFSPLDHEIRTEEVFQFSNYYINSPEKYNVSLSFPSAETALICTGSGAMLLVEIFYDQGREMWKELITSGVLLRERNSCALTCAKMEIASNCVYLHVVIHEIKEKTVENDKIKGKDSLFESIFNWKTFLKGEDRVWSEKCCKKFSINGNVDHIALEPGCQSLFMVCDKHPKWIGSDSGSNTLKQQASGEKIFFWTQTEGEVTLWLPLTSCEPVTKGDISLEISDLTLELKVRDQVLICGNFFQRTESQLSVWCLEKNKLEIQLTKQEYGLMWNLLFLNENRGEEIIDSHVSEAVHKKMSHLFSGENNHPHPPPFDTQQLEECDVPASESTSLIRLDVVNQKITHEVNLSNSQWLFSVSCDPKEAPALCCRQDVDACIWQFKQWQMSDPCTWPYQHLGTFSAFGYVQASKTQKKFIVCAPNLSYVAICEISHHIYIYRQPTFLSSELKNRSTGKKVKSISKQQLVNLEANQQILGVHATNNHLYVLLENSICVLVVNE